MAHTNEKLEAKRLFLEEGKSVREIAAMLNVSEKSVYRWSTEEEWEKDKETMAMTGVTAYKSMLLMAVNQLQRMASGKGDIDARQADALNKVIKSAKSLAKDIDKRGNIMLGISEFVEFMRESHSEKLVEIQPFLVEFGTWVKHKYQ